MMWVDSKVVLWAVNLVVLWAECWDDLKVALRVCCWVAEMALRLVANWAILLAELRGDK